MYADGGDLVVRIIFPGEAAVRGVEPEPPTQVP
jgi:hypothetical protein